MEEDAEAWIKEYSEVRFPVMVQKLHSKLFDFLEAKRSKGDKVTAPVCNAARKFMDVISQKSIEIFEENITLRTQIQEKEKHDKALEDIANKISRTSTSVSVESVGDVFLQSKQFKDDNTVIVSMSTPSEDPLEVKGKIKELFK